MAYPTVPLINGKSYEYADIIINIGGVAVIGATAIEYSEKQNMENIYGAGKFPVSRGYGTIEPTAKVTLLMEEVLSIMGTAPLGRIQDIPEFDIQVIYLDSALTTVKHKLRNVRFMNNGISSKTGDTSIPVELDLIISHIEWQ